MMNGNGPNSNVKRLTCEFLVARQMKRAQAMRAEAGDPTGSLFGYVTIAMRDYLKEDAAGAVEDVNAAMQALRNATDFTKLWPNGATNEELAGDVLERVAEIKQRRTMRDERRERFGGVR